MVNSQRAIGNLVYTIDVNSAKAITQINNVKREVRQLTRDYDNQATQLEILGKHEEAAQKRLEGQRITYQNLNAATKELKTQLDNTNLSSTKSTEQINKLQTQLKELQNKTQGAKNQLEIFERRTVLFKDGLKDLNGVIQNTNRYSDERVKRLQAEGKEQDALAAKADGYKTKIEQLTKKQELQAKGLADYRKRLQEDLNLSGSQLESHLSRDQDYLKMKSYQEETRANITKTEKALGTLRTGYEQNTAKAKAYASETKSLSKLIENQIGSFSAGRYELQRMSKQRDLDMKSIESQVDKMKLLKKASGDNTLAYQKERAELNKMSDSFLTLAKNEEKLKSSKSLFDPNTFSSKRAESIDKANKSIEKWNKRAEVGAGITQKTATATFGLGAAFLYGAKNAAQLENSYHTTSVLMNSGGESQKEVNKNMSALKNQARDSSIKYGIDQHEIASGMQEMTRKGYSSEILRQILDPVLKTSIASGDKLSDVVHNGTAAVEAYNPKRLNMKQFTKDSFNQMAYVADLTATDFQKLGYGMGYVGPTASQAGLNIADTSAALGVLSNQGVEGSSAGTGLRKVLNSLINPTKNGLPVLDELGLVGSPIYKKAKNGRKVLSGFGSNDLLDKDGKLLPLNEVFEKLNSAMSEKGYSANDKNRAFNKLFGTTGQTAGFILSQSTGNKQGELGYLTNQANKASSMDGGKGYIDEISNRNMNTAQNQINRLKEAGKSLATTYATRILPYVTQIAKGAADLFSHLAKASGPTKTLIAIIGAGVPILTAFGLGLTAIAKGVSGFKSLFKFGQIAVGGLSNAQKKFKEGFKLDSQNSELKNQIRRVEELNGVLKENIKLKEKESKIDLDNGSGGKSGGSSNSSTSSKDKTKNKKDKLKNAEKDIENDIGNSSSTVTRKTKTVSNEAKTASKATKEAEKVAKDGSKLSKLKNLKNTKSVRFLKNATGSIGLIGLGLDGLDIASSYFGSSAGERSKNTGGAIGAAAGSGLGMLVPVPGLDLLVSAGLGWFGGKAGETIGSAIDKENQKIKKQEKKDEKTVPSNNKEKNRNSPGRNNAFHSTTEEAEANNPASKKAEDDWKKIRERVDAEKKKKAEDAAYQKKMDTISTATGGENYRNKLQQKYNYDYASGSKQSSDLLRTFVKDSQDATKTWASSIGKSTKDVQDSYNKMADDIKKKTDIRISNDAKTYDTLVKRGIITKDMANSNLQSEKTYAQQRISNLKKSIQDLANADKNGGKGREDAIKKLNSQLVQLTDAGAKQQKSILNQLNKDTGKLDSKRYLEVLKESEKAYKTTVDNANKQYKQTKKSADKELADNLKKINSLHFQNKKQKDDAIRNAKQQHDKVVHQAKVQKDDTVSWATQQRKSVVSEAKKEADGVAGSLTTLGNTVSQVFTTQLNQLNSWNPFASKYSPTKDSKKEFYNHYTNPTAGFDNAKKTLDSKSKSSAKLPGSVSSSVFGSNPIKKQTFNKYALGGHIAKDETALVNEEGEESIYDSKAGTFTLLRGGTGLIKLKSGERVLNAKETAAILANSPDRSMLKGYAKGRKGDDDDNDNDGLTVNVKTKGVKASLKKTKKAIDDIHDTLDKGYKDSTDDSSKHIDDFKKYNESSWKDISDGTQKKTKDLTSATSSEFKKAYANYTKQQKDYASSTSASYKKGYADYLKQQKGYTSSASSTYKKGYADYVKQLKGFGKNSSDNWKKISDTQNKSTKNLSNTTAKTYKGMNDNISKSLKNISNVTNSNTKTTVSNYGKVMGKLPSYAASSMKGAMSSLNKGFSGINSSLKQFGGNVKVLNPIKYALGSNGKLPNDQLAMINDATSGPRQEAVIRDNKVFLPKGNDRVLHLSKGDQVLNGQQTERLMKMMNVNRYAKGSGVSDDDLKKLAEANAKNPDKAWNRDFNSNVTLDGSSLQKGITKSVSNGMQKSGKAWYASMWKLINDTIQGAGSGTKGEFLKYAEKIGTGVPYVYGGFDCSKLIQDALAHFGIDIGRDTVAQSHSSGVKYLGKNINNAEVGDLVYFGTSGENAHVGIVSNKSKGLMMNQTPPSGRISSIQEAANIDGLDGYYSVKGLSSQDKSKKSNSVLDKLVKKQLGSKAIKWIEDKLGDSDQGYGGGYDDNGIIPTKEHENLLKKAGIARSNWGIANEIITKESSWNPHASNGQYYGLAQTDSPKYLRFGGSDYQNNPITQLRAMDGYIKDRYGSYQKAIQFRRANNWYANGGLSTTEKTAHVSEGNRPEMIIPLTNKSRSVQLIMKSLEYMFGNSLKVNNSKENDSADKALIEKLINANKEKDKKIDNILKKMDELISVIQNKPVISEAQIFQANKNQQQQKQRFTNLGKGAF